MKQSAFKTALTQLTNLPKGRHAECLESARSMDDEQRGQFLAELKQISEQDAESVSDEGVAIEKMEELVREGEQKVKKVEKEEQQKEEEQEKNGALEDIEDRINNF